MPDPSTPVLLPLRLGPESPCIRVCTLDDDRVCIGCGRHVDEIVAWTRMSALEQQAVCERSAKRREHRRSAVDSVIGK